MVKFPKIKCPKKVKKEENVIEDSSIINKNRYGQGLIAMIKIDNTGGLKNLIGAKGCSEYRKE